MNFDKNLTPDYLFEVSWEVCNKVGGIHTVIATKALNMAHELENRHILIGPDVWRETGNNPEFLEDARLLRAWRVKAAQEGLRIRVGRWNVSGKPIAILVDFTTFVNKKDEIFTKFWERFQLDSLSGQWDYVEPCLFGYAAGTVIESFIRFNLAPHHKAVAQFHEWMTGTGLLYLKQTHLPVATVFTTHATVLGRCIAGNNLPLYGPMEWYNPEEKAREYNVRAKHSLEKIAAREADAFTTVSDITAKECQHFLEKPVDLVTPNGFENSFTPSEEDFPKAQARGRATLLRLASALLQAPVDDKAFLVGVGGRYEFKNKGIDIFVDALGKLNQDKGDASQILAFVMVPAGHNGPNKELVHNLQHPQAPIPLTQTRCTHYLSNPEYDPVLRRLGELGLHNRPEDRVKVFFLPCYLNGQDGVVNTSYYDLLVGLDLSVFPSYYEPWGYTPLESLAFKVPTVTTSLAGFGLWVEEKYRQLHPGIEVVHRTDDNYSYVVDSVAQKVRTLERMSAPEFAACKENAKEVSTIALWDNLVSYYKQAYSLALSKVQQQIGAFPTQAEDRQDSPYIQSANAPIWRQLFIQRVLPQGLAFLETLAKNLWWSWDDEARELFASINPTRWKQAESNPLELLDKISLRNYQRLEADPLFMDKLHRVEARFNAYMAAKAEISGPQVAYFSMEYGLDKCLRTYSGGLGILAGDYLKESSDKQVNMVGVGLLYRYGYFTQRLSAYGDQVNEYVASDFSRIPVTAVYDADGNWLKVGIAFPGRTCQARVWRVDVGRTELYLLDTDIEENLQEDRHITYQLYGGDWENRLKQEILLGVGGIRLLRKLNKHPEVYHCNEGHAAFIGLERIREYVMDQDLTFREAVEVVRASSLFTTHTPVPAGHDAFAEEMLRTYMGHYPSRMKVSWERMMSLGKVSPQNPNEKFSMSFLATRLSGYVNGVSMLHGKVSQEILAPIWPGYMTEEVPVGYVTNGVHYPTWTAPEWKALHNRVFGPEFATHHYDKSCFENIYRVSDQEVWDVRKVLRSKLVKYIKDLTLEPNVFSSCYTPNELVTIRETLRDDILTIGFARRFATYKRALLLFSNLERLNQVVNHPQRPVQFIFAGKAHPADKAGQDLIKRIIEISKMPQFIGKIIFVPNYDMEVAKYLVQGVDIWMNTPTRPLEASGTSGEKASMNGVMHFSVLDGWWVEGYKEGAGWALPQEQTYENPHFQNELDAATIYNMLEGEIAPLFYASGSLPHEWVKVIKNTIAQVACNFTTNRMITDYEEQYYKPLAQSHARVVAEDFRLAREAAFWKSRMLREWDGIEFLGFHHKESQGGPALGKATPVELRLYLGEIQPRDIRAELVMCVRNAKEEMQLFATRPMQLLSCQDREAVFGCDLVPDQSGSFYVSCRIYAACEGLVSREDFPLVKWL